MKVSRPWFLVVYDPPNRGQDDPVVMRGHVEGRRELGQAMTDVLRYLKDHQTAYVVVRSDAGRATNGPKPAGASFKGWEIFEEKPEEVGDDDGEDDESG